MVTPPRCRVCLSSKALILLWRVCRFAEGFGCVVAVTVVGFKRRFDNGSLYTRELMFERFSASVDTMLAKFLTAMRVMIGIPSKRGYPDPENAQANLFDDDWFIAQAVDRARNKIDGGSRCGQCTGLFDCDVCPLNPSNGRAAGRLFGASISILGRSGKFTKVGVSMASCTRRHVRRYSMSKPISAAQSCSGWLGFDGGLRFGGSGENIPPGSGSDIADASEPSDLSDTSDPSSR